GAGAEWIGKRAAHVVGGPGITVIEIVDSSHAYDHLWAVGRAFFATPEALSAGGEPRKDALYTHPLYPPSIPPLYTHPLYPPSIPTLYTHPLYPPSIPTLYTQGASAVLAARDALVPSDTAAADLVLVRTPRAYCADNAARRDYPRVVAQQVGCRSARGRWSVCARV